MKRRAGSATVLGRQVGAHPCADGAQLHCLQCGIGVQRREGLIRIEVRVSDDCRMPIFLLAPWRDAHRDPGCGAHAQEETDNSRRKFAQSDPGERPRRPREGRSAAGAQREGGEAALFR